MTANPKCIVVCIDENDIIRMSYIDGRGVGRQIAFSASEATEVAGLLTQAAVLLCKGGDR